MDSAAKTRQCAPFWKIPQQGKGYRIDSVEDTNTSLFRSDVWSVQQARHHLRVTGRQVADVVLANVSRGATLFAPHGCQRGHPLRQPFLPLSAVNQEKHAVRNVALPYPTYSTAVQQMAADIAVEHLLSGTSGKLLRGVSRAIR
jgi:hypothetical protein